MLTLFYQSLTNRGIGVRYVCVCIIFSAISISAAALTIIIYNVFDRMRIDPRDADPTIVLGSTLFYNRAAYYQHIQKLTIMFGGSTCLGFGVAAGMMAFLMLRRRPILAIVCLILSGIGIIVMLNRLMTGQVHE